MKNDLAIFDLDGTLADTLCDLADATNHGLKILGYPEHDYDKYRYFVGNGVRKLCERALPEDKKDEADRLLELFSSYYGVHFLDKTQLYPGIHDMLKRLSADGVMLAVATNKPQTFAREITAALLPDIPFISVLGGCEERPKKPDTAVIQEILSAFSALPGSPEADRVYMAGDSDVDIQTAKNAGVTGIGCVWGFRGLEELSAAGADFIARTAGDIYSIISADRGSLPE
ncbi:MAG: HAD family hydrolase [Ruminococcus sp.]|nr:HAD family hydrolase [Ruminococcus sp.]